ncbi:hypothetical protein MNV49_002906 [Pseudohyphozyma bogoriensis]|nr:hypothetical protein MNV49_002906 [Pseudohyphozyma bogoriensis]
MSNLNIWLAAGEGNLARVTELVESGMSPSIPDENTYTPLHAAASWGHPEILRYLVSKGGDINVADSDNETPLFVVETAEMARIVIELGGDPNWKNEDGITQAAQSLEEEHPHISLYLRSLTGELPLASTSTLTSTTSGDSTSPADLSSPDLDEPTDALMAQVQLIMEASERGELSPEETDEKLKEIVTRAVAGQVEKGREIGEAMEEEEEGGVRDRAYGDEGAEDAAGKRRKDEPGSFEGDYLLLSADGREFRINPRFLAWHSEVFRDMFATGNVEEVEDTERCRLTESGDEVEVFFRALAGKKPKLLDEAEVTIRLCDKYQCLSLAGSVQAQLWPLVAQDPLRVFPMACVSGNEELAQAAAAASVGKNMDRWAYVADDSARLRLGADGPPNSAQRGTKLSPQS